MQEMQETQDRLLGQEDPLEMVKATHSSIHAWEIPWTEEPGGLQSMEFQESDMTQWLNHHQGSSTDCIANSTTQILPRLTCNP